MSPRNFSTFTRGLRYSKAATNSGAGHLAVDPNPVFISLERPQLIVQRVVHVQGEHHLKIARSQQARQGRYPSANSNRSRGPLNAAHLRGQ